jgi:hypothetical protein
MDTTEPSNLVNQRFETIEPSATVLSGWKGKLPCENHHLKTEFVLIANQNS